MADKDALLPYKSKRNFAVTSEPAEGGDAQPDGLQFVVQKHWASRLHYDLRLELDGTMKSWAVPKGPSYDPKDKRMAVHVEDHPIAYNRFEGQIPAKQYGAGKVIIWDKGTWIPLTDPHQGYRDGMLKFELHGHKLLGHWALIRIKNRRNSKQDTWLLIKEKDDHVRPALEYSVVDEMPDSVSRLAHPVVSASQPGPGPKRKVANTPGPAAKIQTLTGAVRGEAPDSLSPVLATLVDHPPADVGEWLYEIKFDGYRMLARTDTQGGVRLFTRNGHDWTDRLKHLAQALHAMKLKPGWLDGEVVMLDAHGMPDFQALQGAFDNAQTGAIVYYLFDVPFYGGYDLRATPLLERRALLEGLLADAPPALRFSAIFDAPAEALVSSACHLGLEGVIGKRKDSAYVSRRSAEWIKLKCTRRQEFVIGGYTDPKGMRTGLGALLLGVHDDSGALVYAGSVGSGFNDRSLALVLDKLRPLETDQRPFKDRTGNDRSAHWVSPQLVAEVSFSEWTADGHLRHPVFQALRTDKPAKSVLREKPGPGSRQAPPAAGNSLASKLRVSNPERVIDESTGITKMELVRFYALVGPLMMDHLKARPMSLVRAPAGIAGELFFQKHLDKGAIAGIRQLDASLHPDHAQLLEVATPAGLLSVAQLNCIELHTWNAVKTSITKPDRMIFDIDPGEGVDWPAIQQGATLVKVFLEQLGLASFLKTSGGKGLHVVVPIRKQYGWAQVKGFSEAIVQHMARTLPQLFVARLGPRNRVGKIFIDYLRNGFGATTACAWSARARPGLGVSVPMTWEELSHIGGGAHWHLRNIHTRLDRGNAPWAKYASARQGLVSPMKTLGFKA